MTFIDLTPKSICDLLAEMTALREQVEEQGATTFSGFEPFIQREDYSPSARNLADYLALRQHNLRELQFRLMHLGFASLGRVEADVLGALTAIERTLTSLCEGTPYMPVNDSAPFTGSNQLRAAADLIFGEQPEGHVVHIMVTMPTEAATDAELVAELVRRGMTCARINCAHDDADAWAAMIDNVKAAADAQGRECRIYMDLGGPKIRTDDISFDKKHRFFPGDTLLLTPNTPKPTDAYPYQVTCNMPEVLSQVAPGETVWFDDGKIGAQVTAVVPEGVVLQIEKTPPKGNRVRLRKGINFPETQVDISPLTDKDLVDLDFIAKHADMVGYSFVQQADDISRLQDELLARLDDPADLQKIAIIAKIETKLAVSNLPDLIVRGAGRQPFGVMVARGDLAVEIGFTRLAEMQEEILWVCEAAHVPVIWATQVLESTTKNGVISRAEVTDAASGIKAECVMLNKGDHVTESVTTLHNILKRMAGHRYKKFSVLRVLHSWERYVKD